MQYFFRYHCRKHRSIAHFPKPEKHVVKRNQIMRKTITAAVLFFYRIAVAAH